jgi:hypothetical protein
MLKDLLECKVTLEALAGEFFVMNICFGSLALLELGLSEVYDCK